MSFEQYLIKYCSDEIAKAKNETRNKTHLRYRGRLEAFIEVLEILNKEIDYYKTHCKKCGEWLEGSDMCPECGMINEE